MNDSRVQKHKITPLNVANVEALIRGQAALHFAEFTGDMSVFRKDLQIDQTRNAQNVPLLHGLFYATAGFEPIGYTFFYPMFNRNGKLGFWGEDTFVDENYRRMGIGRKIIGNRIEQMFDISETIYRSFPPHFLDWVTAENNVDYHKFVKKLYGIQDSRKAFEILDATHILGTANDTILRGPGELKAKRIDIRDAYLIDKMNQALPEERQIDPAFTGQSLHFPLLGFVVTRGESDVPVAAMVTNVRYSTFRTQWDLAAQPIIFTEELNQEDKQEVIKALFMAVRNFRQETSQRGELNCGDSHFTLMSKRGTDENSILREHFGLQRLRISANDAKIAVPYRADEEVLMRMANRDVRVIEVA